MQNSIIRLLKLFLGLFLYALGIVLTINANLGLSPWDVFHQGLGRVAGLTMGQASIIVGLVLVVVNVALGERIGWGTLGNMVFIGLFLDFLMLNHYVPACHNWLSGTVMMLSGLYVIGIATYFYLAAELGAGPRDGLMVALTKKTGKSVRLIRNSIELSVLVVGYFLGGYVGIGTVVMAVVIGYFVQFNLKLFKFDVNSIQHRFIDDDIRYVMGVLGKGTSKQENS
ncbi:MAG TPA: hypothetical protein VHS59_11025 [Bacillota bacterium]|nr:hypothetical protein [Bacillota bacterium]